MKNTVLRINEVSTKETVKNYIEVVFNNEKYLVTTNGLGRVRYVSKMIPNRLYSRGYELKSVHTNSIKSVFGITKRKFDEMIEGFKEKQIKIENILEQQCDDCDDCKISKFCNDGNFDYNLIYKNQEEILNIGIDEPVSILERVSNMCFFDECEIDETFAKQWEKIIDAAIEQDETIVFKQKIYSKNVEANVGLDTYVLPLNEIMRELDINYLLCELNDIVRFLYEINSIYIEVKPQTDSLPF